MSSGETQDVILLGSADVWNGVSNGTSSWQTQSPFLLCECSSAAMKSESGKMLQDQKPYDSKFVIDPLMVIK